MPGVIFRGLTLFVCRFGGVGNRTRGQECAITRLLHTRSKTEGVAKMSTASEGGKAAVGDRATSMAKPSTAHAIGDEGYRERKASMRQRIKAALKGMDKYAVDAGSATVVERLLVTPQLAEPSAQNSGVSVYLSMPGELATEALVVELFKRGKKVYIPKVMGPLSADMRMFPLESDQEASSFPLTKWKIPEPPEDLVLSREDGTFAGDIDLVVVPAMAFDARCNRLGHGRGYYDCFFERVNKSNADKGRPSPITMGVCFDEQVVDEVPTSLSDVPLDFVFTPTRTFRRVADKP